jgi:hypothetical protein
MQYIKPYTYFLSKPGGGTNLLWGSLAFLSSSVIPIIGPLIWMGYIVEVVRALKQDPDIEDHPNFDTNKLMHYLSLGVWPLAMGLLLALGFFCIMLFILALAVAVGVVAQEPIYGIIVFLVLLLPASLMFSALIWPMTLYSQLRQALELPSAIRFTLRFLKLVGGQTVISLIVHFLISQALGFVGMLLCFIGLYPAMVLTSMAQEHYMVQLYRLYLDEGGEPLVMAEIEEPTPRQKRRQWDDDEDDEEAK